MSKLFDFSVVDREAASIEHPTARIAHKNRLIDKLYEEDICRAGWLLLKPGERLELPVGGSAIVLGTVPWNRLDRELLTDAALLLRGRKNVFVVNLDHVHSIADLSAVMPGVPLPTETPVVAEYAAGELRHLAVGREAGVFLREKESARLH